MLAQLVRDCPDELGADLMETYGICIEEAMEGRYSAPFVASLAMQLPRGCRWRISYDRDAWWDDDRLLMAALINNLRGLIWGMGDPKRRGPEPKPVGPKWAIEGAGAGHKLRATVMGKDALLAELARPRREG